MTGVAGWIGAAGRVCAISVAVAIVVDSVGAKPSLRHRRHTAIGRTRALVFTRTAGAIAAERSSPAVDLAGKAVLVTLTGRVAAAVAAAGDRSFSAGEAT